MEQNITPAEAVTAQQTPVVTSAPLQAPVFTPSPPHKSRMWKVILICIVLLLLFAGSTFAYLSLQDSSSIVSKGFTKLGDTKAYQIETVLTDTPQSGGSPVKINVMLKTNLSDEANPLLESALKAELLGFIIDGEFKMIKDSFYVKINQAPFVSMFLEQANASGKWISFNKEDTAALPFASEIQKSESTSFQDKMSEFISRGVIVFTENKFLIQGGVPVRESHFEVDKAALEAYVRDTVTKKAKDLGQTEASIENELESLPKFLENITFKDSYVTTNLFTNTVNKVSVSATVDISEDETKEDNHDVTVVTTIKELPADTAIEVPSESIDIEKVIGGSMEEYFVGTNLEPKIEEKLKIPAPTVSTKTVIPASTAASFVVSGVTITPGIDRSLLDNQDLEGIQTQIFEWKEVDTLEDCANVSPLLQNSPDAEARKRGQAFVNACAYYLLQ